MTEHSGGGIVNAIFAFNWHKASVSVDVKLADAAGNPVTAASAGWSVFEDSTHKTFLFDGVLPPGNYAADATANGGVQMITMLSGTLLHGVDFSVGLSQPPALPQTPSAPAITSSAICAVCRLTYPST